MATAQSANELKQQGAIEAARDPDSTVTPEAAEKKIVEESKKAGVPAFNFDPDASMEQKKAQVRAVRHHRTQLPAARYNFSSCVHSLTRGRRPFPTVFTNDPRALK